MAQVNNLPQLKNQFLLVYILQNLVQVVLNCKLLYQNDVQALDELPYVSYGFVTVQDDTTTDNTNQFISDVQIDVHARNPMQASDMAKLLRDSLKDESYRRFFTQARIVPQVLTQTSDRTVLAGTSGGVNYDYDVGFDCSFLVTGNYIYQPSELNFEVPEDIDIRSTTATDEVSSSFINAKKEKDN